MYTDKTPLFHKRLTAIKWSRGCTKDCQTGGGGPQGVFMAASCLLESLAPTSFTFLRLLVSSAPSHSSSFCTPPPRSCLNDFCSILWGPACSCPWDGLGSSPLYHWLTFSSCCPCSSALGLGFQPIAHPGLLGSGSQFGQLLDPRSNLSLVSWTALWPS